MAKGFTNPYNFVDVDVLKAPEKKNKKDTVGINNAVSGVLHCKIIAKTSIAIPDAETEKKESNGHKSYDFMSISKNGKKAFFIPGSSIRGVIRSVFETATDSCFSIFNETSGKGKKRIKYSVGEKACCDGIDLCEACSLFGIISKKDNNAIGSKIRISDAFLTKGNVDDFKTTVVPLGTPNSSYKKLYVMKEEIEEKKDNNHYYKARRKYYWHSDNNKQIYNNWKNGLKNNKSVKQKVNASLQLAPKNTEFTFNIFYDNISEEQLKQLIWAVNFWENNENSNLCHKIGHGKPVGLGSVKIIVLENVKRVFSSNEYKEYVITSEKVCDSSTPFSKNNKVVKQLFNICKFDTSFNQSLNVRYPGVKWFKNYKKDDMKTPDINDVANGQRLPSLD